MPNWKKLIVSGSDARINSLFTSGHVTASGNITGSASSTGSFGQLLVGGVEVGGHPIIADDSTTDNDHHITFVNNEGDGSTAQQLQTDSALRYNPSSNLLHTTSSLAKSPFIRFTTISGNDFNILLAGTSTGASGATTTTAGEFRAGGDDHGLTFNPTAGTGGTLKVANINSTASLANSPFINFTTTTNSDFNILLAGTSTLAGGTTTTSAGQFRAGGDDHGLTFNPTLGTGGTLKVANVESTASLADKVTVDWEINHDADYYIAATGTALGTDESKVSKQIRGLSLRFNPSTNTLKTTSVEATASVASKIGVRWETTHDADYYFVGTGTVLGTDEEVTNKVPQGLPIKFNPGTSTLKTTNVEATASVASKVGIQWETTDNAYYYLVGSGTALGTDEAITNKRLQGLGLRYNPGVDQLKVTTVEATSSVANKVGLQWETNHNADYYLVGSGTVLGTDEAITNKRLQGLSLKFNPSTNILTTTASLASLATTATSANKVKVTDNENTDENNLITFVADASATTGNKSLEMDGNLTYNPSTGRLTSTQLAADFLFGDGTNITNLPSPPISVYNETGDNRVITSVSSNTVQGEENLTFDGSTLAVTGGVTISGNLSVSGTTTTVNSTEVSIADRILTLNAGSAAGDGGIYVNDASTTETGSLLWDVSDNRWIGGLKDNEVKLVTLSSTDTLTNKTLTAPIITSIVPAVGQTLTLPSTTGTLARTSDNVASATVLETARNIGGVSFDGSADINLPGVNQAGTQDTSGTAAVATLITVTDNESTNEENLITFVRNGNDSTGNHGLEMDGQLTYNPSTGTLSSTTFSGNLSGTATNANHVLVTDNESANEENLITFVENAQDGTGNHGLEMDGQLTYNPSSGTVTATGFAGNLSGNATSATVLATARDIGGVSFNGSQNIDLPGVNTAGNQNTSGTAATATALANARTIGGVSFDGTANIDLPGVNTGGNQDTSGNAATATTSETASLATGVQVSRMGNAFTQDLNVMLGGANGAGGSSGTDATTLKLTAPTSQNHLKYNVDTGKLSGVQNLEGTASIATNVHYIAHSKTSSFNSANFGGFFYDIPLLKIDGVPIERDASHTLVGHTDDARPTLGVGENRIRYNAVTMHLSGSVSSSASFANIFAVGSSSFNDLTVTGNIGIGGTIDGRDLQADGTKLDGIEANADVTDTDNVTAAGAVMDSEVTNLSFVKGLTSGISNGNVLVANANVVDNDFLKIDGTSVEGRTASEVRSDLNVEDGADVTDTDNVTAAGAVMDSEVYDLAGVKGVFIANLATITGSETLTNKTLTSPDINGGTIDESDITVGTGKTLDVSNGTFTLADNQISGNKVEGGTIASITISQLGGALDANNQAITNVDIDSGDISGTDINLTGQTLTLDNDQISGDKVEGGTIASTTITSLASTNVVTTHLTASNDISSSITSTGSFGFLNVPGDAVIGGTVRAQEFHTEFVSASIIFESGSSQFGNTLDDTHDFIGTMSITGSLTGSYDTSASFAYVRAHGNMEALGTGSFRVLEVVEQVESQGTITAPGFVSTGDSSFNDDVVLGGDKTHSVTLRSHITSSVGVNISGSFTSTGSFGRVEMSTGKVNGDFAITDDLVVTDDAQVGGVFSATGNTIFGNNVADTHTFTGHITSSGHITGSFISTGSFGKVHGTTLTGTILTSAQPNITSLGTLSSIDIDGGNIDGTTIATSNITVGNSKTLDVSAGTLTTSATQNLNIIQGANSNIDIGGFELRAETLESDVATGTAPLTVSSTTLVSNLNADKLDGQDGSHYLDFGNFVIDNDEIPIAKLESDSVSYGGVEVTLGNSDTTPAFNLQDATAYPGDSSLITTGTVTTGVWNSTFGTAASASISGAFTADSASFSVRVNALKTDSGSFSLRTNALETTMVSEQSNIDTLQTTLASEQTNIDNLQSDSGSFSTRVTALKTDSGSFSTRVTNLEDNTNDVTFAAGLDYLSLSGQEITMNQIDLTSDVTGALPLSNTSLIAGTNITLNTNTLNVDDAFLINSGDDSTTGTITSAGFITTGNVTSSFTSTGSFGRIETAGNIVPKAHNVSELGSPTNRWANIYSADLQLSNEDNEVGNEIDGTKGSWTIQEGEDDLYLLNRKNGKKYKFKLEEIT